VRFTLWFRHALIGTCYGVHYADVGIRCKYTVITGEIGPGPGHQGDQPGDEVLWLENHVGGTVVVGCFELIAYLTVAGQGQALGRYRRANVVVMSASSPASEILR
jgi:hypothetical protein